MTSTVLFRSVYVGRQMYVYIYIYSYIYIHIYIYIEREREVLCIGKGQRG